MAKAKKLPSGNWSVQAYSHTVTVNGKQKRVYERFTAPTRKEAEYLAAEFQMNKSRKKSMETMTVAQAIESYIDSKSNILSPSTIKSYRSLQRNHYHDIGKIPLQKLTRQMVQREFNLYAASLSPKTCRNLHGLLSAALEMYHPDFRLKTNMPKKTKNEIHIPTEAELHCLLSRSRGTPLFLPIILAFSMGLRRGEICGLRWKDINLEKHTIHVHTSLVQNEKKEWVEKPPKTYAGNRILDIPPFVYVELEKLYPEQKNSRITDLMPDNITNMFPGLLRRSGLRHFRFHDLRHYYASIMLANNVPDKYQHKMQHEKKETLISQGFQSGDGGIRTHGRFDPSTDFESASL